MLVIEQHQNISGCVLSISQLACGILKDRHTVIGDLVIDMSR
jgi:hypothetical protein